MDSPLRYTVEGAGNNVAFLYLTDNSSDVLNVSGLGGRWTHSVSAEETVSGTDYAGIWNGVGCTAGAGSITWTGATDIDVHAIYEYSGGSSGVADATGSNAGTTNATLSLTTVTANDLIVGIIHGVGIRRVTGPSSPWNSETLGTYQAITYQIVTTAHGYTATFSSASAHFVGAIAAFARTSE